MTQDSLDQKVLEIFDGRVVRKDLLHRIKKGTNVPTFVLEFFLARFCATDDEEEAVDHRAAVAGARRRRRASCCRLRPRPVLGVQRVQVAQAARPLVTAEDDQVIAVQAGGVEVARLRLPAAGGRLVPLVVHRVEDAHVVEPAARIGTPEDHQVRRHPQRRA